jgi:hypothetical protein
MTTILAVAFAALAITIELLGRVAKSIPPQPESETTP